MRDRLRLVLLTALSGMVFLCGCGSPENAAASGGEPTVSVSASKEEMLGPEESSGKPAEREASQAVSSPEGGTR